MKNTALGQHEKYPDPYHDAYSRSVFGFWVYLLTDFILFGSLFATYAVLHNNTFGGPPASELFHLHYALAETFVLLTCSFVVGLAGAAAHRRDKKLTISLFAATFVLGIIFMGMEISEMSRLIESGNSWQRSAFLSSYFTLVGTHGVHILFGLLWIPILLFPVLREGLTAVSIRRLTCLRMFWQFLNIVWIFIFSFVYLMGAAT
ncbi:MAG: cytochrome c oxidase subunit 3 [Candidatus Melainabacteria bacterium]|nr:cytochrome c oxidase subunit 3 [Candidatus Melainabacteria bacterium]